MLTLILSLFNLYNQKATASDNVLIVEKSFSNYNELKVTSAFNVYVQFSATEEKVAIEANEHLHPYIKTHQKGQRLIVELLDNINISTKDVMNIHITTKHIDTFIGAGKVQFNIKDLIAAPAVGITLKGKSTFTGVVETGTLKVDMKGQATVNIAGVSKQLNLVAAGKSRMKEYTLQTDYVEANLKGACAIQLVAEKQVNVNMQGQSKLQFKGNGCIGQQYNKGVARVEKIH